MFLFTSSVISAMAVGTAMLGQVAVDPGAQCHVNFDQDIQVSPQRLEVVQGDSHWQWHEHGELSLNQQPQAIDSETQALLSQYHQGIYSQAEQLDAIMTEAAAMTRYALNVTFSEMFSPRHRVVKRIDALADDIELEMRSIVGLHGDTYHINGSQLDEFGDRLGDTIDTEIDAIVTDSMGSMMMMVGRALLTGSGSFENRMAQFETRMETMAETLEAEIETRAANLEHSAENMCANMLELRALEQQLQQRHASLSNLALFRQDDQSAQLTITSEK
ncbi:MAG: DUF2884 family protein [Idiomarina sp.]|nr:DUF2884 family protein [Idiomarina sp.]